MSAGDLWYAVGAANGVVYVAFVVRRGEAGLVTSVLMALLLGPFAWFVWLGRRAGVRRAAKSR